MGQQKVLLILLLIAVTSEGSSTWVKPTAKPNDQNSAQSKLNFWTGFSLFRSPWVAAPSSTSGRDGLGPVFNARSCDACHRHGAAGSPLRERFGLVVRLSSENDILKGPKPLQNYGLQLQTFSIDSITGGNQVPPEGRIHIEWRQVAPAAIRSEEWRRVGTPLVKPELVFRDVAYGKEVENAQVSLRLAPPLFGLGAIDGLEASLILQNEDENDLNGDGISGRVNKVMDIKSGELKVGRFGYKAEQPNLLQQVASAFHEDIGLSSWLYPQQNCPEAQTACNKMPTGNSVEEGVEISREKLAVVAHFSKNLKAATGRKQQQAAHKQSGYRHFISAGCQACHIESLDGKNYFYSDLLLHDMGEGLSDRRGVFRANPEEWRTTPLWGLHRKIAGQTGRQKKPTAQSQSAALLHDGRARTIEEAILWHDGEARQARRAYQVLSAREKSELVGFLKSL